jgi:Chaperone of endosialidase
MKYLRWLIAALLFASVAHAQTTITGLPTGSALTGTEYLPMDQSGFCAGTGGTCKTTPAAFLTYIEANASFNANVITSGTLGAAYLPTPTFSAIGAVEAYASVSNQFLTSLGTNGIFTSAQPSAANLSNGVTGTGAVVLATSPTLVTPTLGAAIATSVNGNTFTTGTYTLTGSAGKTLDFTNSLTLSGTDSTTMTFPATSGTVSVLNNAQTFTALKTFTNGDLALLGSSTGYTLLESGLASTSNNTLLLPTTASDTLAAIGTAQTWTAAQTFDNIEFAASQSAAGNGFYNGAAGNQVNVSINGSSIGDFTSTGLNSMAVGASTASTGAFTTLTANGTTNINASNNAATNLGTGTTTSTVTVGGVDNTVDIGGPLSLTSAGGISAASWTTAGLALSGTAETLTDSTATGTVTNESAAALPAYTIAASNTSVTISNLDELYLPAPIAGTHVTATHLWSLYTAGAVSINGSLIANNGATVGSGATITGTSSINASSNSATNINTGSSTSTATIGNSSDTVAIAGGTVTMANISSNTGAQTGYLCWSSGGITYDGTNTCLVSAARFKKDIAPLADGLDEVLQLKPVSFFYRNPFPGDLNMANEQIGFIAEDVAQVEPRLVTYDKDGQLHGVRYEQMSALLTKGEQELQAEVTELRAQNKALEARLERLEHAQH